MAMALPSVRPGAVPDPLDLYMKEVGDVGRGLLTASEERVLALAIQAGRTAQMCLGDSVPHSEAEQQQWVAAVHTGQEATQALTCANLRLVISIAVKYTGRGLALTDLIQEGNSGLLHAVATYDPARGTRFSTHATAWIRQAILRALSDQARTVRLPAYLDEAVGRIHQIIQAFEQKWEREPTPTEIAAQLGWPLLRVQAVREAARPPLSLNQPGSNDPTAPPLIDCLAGATDPAEAATRALFMDDVAREVAARLTPREQRVIDGRYHAGRTLADLAEEMDLTRERIRQIEAAALLKLHASRVLRAYYEES